MHAVYGRDNRLKVARDEAAHAAQQAEQDEKHRAAEAQARRQLLLERAKQRRQAALGGHADALEGSRDGSASDADADLELQQHEQRSAGQRKPSAHARQQQGSAHRSLDDPGSRAHKRQRVQEDLQDHQQLQAQQQHQQGQQLSTADDVQEERALKHINFWEELETKAQHPERQVSRIIGAAPANLHVNRTCHTISWQSWGSVAVAAHMQQQLRNARAEGSF